MIRVLCGALTCVVLSGAACHGQNSLGREPLTISYRVDDGAVLLRLNNLSALPVVVSTPFMMASGGNVTAVLIDSNANLWLPCYRRDALAPPENGRTLPRRSGVDIWSGTVDEIARQHCLAPGTYFLHFAYRVEPDRVLLSGSQAVRSDKDFSGDP